MSTTKNKALKVGALVFAALSILVVTIYLIGSKDNLFTKRINVTCAFNDIRGLVVGNNVRFSGINVGNVKDIEITSDSTVVLTLSIADEYSKFIYKNSIVEINQDGLMGGKIITIGDGDPKYKSIEEGDRLRVKAGIDIENYLTQADDILRKATGALESITSVAHKIDSGKGDLAKLINDDELTTELETATRRLNSTLANVNQIAAKINNGEGDLAMLLNENSITDKTYQVLSNLNNTSLKTDSVASQLQIAVRSFNSGEGAVNYLLNSPDLTQDLDTTIQNVNTSLENFNRTAKAIENSWIIQLFSKNKKKKDK